MRVAVIETGVANLASVLAGFRRIGAQPFLTADPEVVRTAQRVVLPGVGAFGAAMAELDGRGLSDTLRQRIADEQATLCVCLGLQLLAEASEETPGVAGLGVFAGTVRRFPETVRVPQLGWNTVAAPADAEILADGYTYFANSYRLTQAPAGWRAAMSDYAGPFVAAMERGPGGRVLACQFHPELSGAYGQTLLTRWLEQSPC